MILFAAGDVGGARALLPVAAECDRRGLTVAVLRHGHIVRDWPVHWPVIPMPFGVRESEMAAMLAGRDVTVLVFSSSVHDTLPLQFARQAKDRGVPVVHVLDNWSNYRRRLDHDGLPVLIPDVYAVMDDVACAAAISAGVPAKIVRVVGQPALASLANDCLAVSAGQRGSGPVRLLFVSEPVEADQGADLQSPSFRGYTEKTVLRLLCHALQPYADKIEVCILPHPREEWQALAGYWSEVKGDLAGEVLLNFHGRQQMLAAEGVIGMASLLLYEAWLVGKPVCSVQPELRTLSLRMLAQRPGVCFVDASKNISDALDVWLPMVRRQKIVAQPDLKRHETAAAHIVSLLQEFV